MDKNDVVESIVGCTVITGLGIFIGSMLGYFI